MCFILEALYKFLNARKAKVADEAKIKYSEEELFDLGDKSPVRSSKTLSIRHVLTRSSSFSSMSCNVMLLKERNDKPRDSNRSTIQRVRERG